METRLGGMFLLFVFGLSRKSISDTKIFFFRQDKAKVAAEEVNSRGGKKIKRVAFPSAEFLLREGLADHWSQKLSS